MLNVISVLNICCIYGFYFHFPLYFRHVVDLCLHAKTTVVLTVVICGSPLPRSQKLSWAKRLSQALHTNTSSSSTDAQGYSTVGQAPPPSPPSRCLPHHHHQLYPAETDEELVISPYASFNCMSEPSTPLICSWLDKLSPQGCVDGCSSLNSFIRVQ